MRRTPFPGRAGWLSVVALALATPALIQAGSIFDALPHMKKPNRPICNNYGECYGHFSVTYRPWPAACVVNPPFAPARKPTQDTLPPPRTEPEDMPEKKPGAPSTGVLLEVEDEPVGVGRISSQSIPASARPNLPPAPRAQR